MALLNTVSLDGDDASPEIDPEAADPRFREFSLSDLSGDSVVAMSSSELNQICNSSPLLLVSEEVIDGANARNGVGCYAFRYVSVLHLLGDISIVYWFFLVFRVVSL